MKYRHVAPLCFYNKKNSKNNPASGEERLYSTSAPSDSDGKQTNMYEPNRDITGTLEKKGTVGIWSKKFVIFRGLTLTISDAEGGAPFATLDLIAVGRVEGDSQAMLFRAKTEELQLRGTDQRIADYWWDVTTAALVHHKLLKPRSCGLPPIDPRFNLKFAEIPSEFVQKFEKLDKCVLYWFAPIKKYGAISKITRRHMVEDRVGCCGDKAFYITKTSGDLTRCIKIVNLKKLFTNYQSKADSKDETFLVIRALPPDFDVYFSSPSVDVLVECFQNVYMYFSKGIPLDVVHVKTAAEVEMQLERPDNFTQQMLVPTPKTELKKALDAYGKKNGIKFTQAGVEDLSNSNISPIISPNISPALGSGELAEQSPDGAGLPPTDPLAVFLTMMGMGRIYLSLFRQSIDLDIMECMDESDIKGFCGVTEPDAQRLKRSLGDAALMASVRAKVEQARAKAKWGVEVKSSSGSSALAPVAPAQPKPAFAPVILDDDDDLDALVIQASAPQLTPAFEFNDSDDDLVVQVTPAAATKAPAPAINLDDDDDI